MRLEAREGLEAVAATTHFRLYESVAIGSVAWERQTRDVCSHPKPSCCRSSVERGAPLPVAEGMEAREMSCDRGQMSSVQRSRQAARHGWAQDCPFAIAVRPGPKQRHEPRDAEALIFLLLPRNRHISLRGGEPSSALTVATMALCRGCLKPPGVTLADLRAYIKHELRDGVQPPQRCARSYLTTLDFCACSLELRHDGDEAADV